MLAGFFCRFYRLRISFFLQFMFGFHLRNYRRYEAKKNNKNQRYNYYFQFHLIPPLPALLGRAVKS